MNIVVRFSQEPLLLVSDETFSNKSMLAIDGNQQVVFGDRIPKMAQTEHIEDQELNWVCDHLAEVSLAKEIHFLVIQQHFIGKNSGIRLISHIRLCINKNVSQLPIIVLTDKEADRFSPKRQADWETIAPLFSSGVRFTSEKDKERRYVKNDSLLIQEIEKLYAELTQDGKNEVEISQFTDYESPAIPVSKPEVSTHQVTNDWGAYRLIQAAGIVHKHEYPKHLYFKYLQRSAVEPNPVDEKTFKDKISQNIRILLIDDNYNKGWKDSIELILSKCLLADGYSATVDPQDYADNIDSLLLKPENGNCPIDDYDLVYLDLRLPKDSVSRGNPTLENGKGVLKKIKDYNPTIPVIMFTASTKATNMDDLYEMGVDGYFVKESPETRNDPDFSKNNLAGFVKSTRNCVDKGALLRPYWKEIQLIAANNIIHEHSFRRSNNTDITRIKQRVNERLSMFLGILKKAFEQTQFDRNQYFYDEYETAYITLWSCLNDVVASHYERRNRPIWKDIFTNSFFINMDLQTPLKWCYDISPHYSVEQELDGTLKYEPFPDKINFRKTLHNQVAFLIYCIAKHFNHIDEERDSMWVNLNKANEIRNSLWLTHSELSGSNYLENFRRVLEDTNPLAKERRMLEWQTKIRELFSLVMFLVKGR